MRLVRSVVNNHSPPGTKTIKAPLTDEDECKKTAAGLVKLTTDQEKNGPDTLNAAWVAEQFPPEVLMRGDYHVIMMTAQHSGVLAFCVFKIDGEVLEIKALCSGGGGRGGMMLLVAFALAIEMGAKKTTLVLACGPERNVRAYELYKTFGYKIHGPEVDDDHSIQMQCCMADTIEAYVIVINAAADIFHEKIFLKQKQHRAHSDDSVVVGHVMDGFDPIGELKALKKQENDIQKMRSKIMSLEATLEKKKEKKSLKRKHTHTKLIAKLQRLKKIKPDLKTNEVKKMVQERISVIEEGIEYTK